MQLDYSLTTSEERIKCVEQLLAETPPEKLTKEETDMFKRLKEISKFNPRRV